MNMKTLKEEKISLIPVPKKVLEQMRECLFENILFVKKKSGMT